MYADATSKHQHHSPLHRHCRRFYQWILHEFYIINIHFHLDLQLLLEDCLDSCSYSNSHIFHYINKNIHLLVVQNGQDRYTNSCLFYYKCFNTVHWTLVVNVLVSILLFDTVTCESYPWNRTVIMIVIYLNTSCVFTILITTFLHFVCKLRISKQNKTAKYIAIMLQKV